MSDMMNLSEAKRRLLLAKLLPPEDNNQANKPNAAKVFKSR